MKKRTLIFCILSAIFFIGSVGLFFSSSSIANMTEDNTTEYFATIESLNIIEHDNESFVEIYTEEYFTMLYISESICKEISVSELKTGDKIAFRIDNDVTKLFNKDIKFCNIVSLMTSSDTIFTLNDYNSIMKITLVPGKIASIVLAIIFLLCFLGCIYNYKKNKARHGKQSGDG